MLCKTEMKVEKAADLALNLKILDARRLRTYGSYQSEGPKKFKRWQAEDKGKAQKANKTCKSDKQSQSKKREEVVFSKMTGDTYYLIISRDNIKCER